MATNKEAYTSISRDLKERNVKLVAVSKTKPASDILELYNFGQKDFGENYVQELIEKQSQLPADIQWHFIGHLQSNKVKSIASFVHLIHGVDSFKLLKEINKQAQKIDRVIDCLLQVHIAQEETKFGFDKEELNELFTVKSEELQGLRNIRVAGFMGMASFTNDTGTVRDEFKFLKSLSDGLATLQISNFNPGILSMGMSSDYKIAIEEGSTMVRIGSLLFGDRIKAS
jgi:hypothetical protein